MRDRFGIFSTFIRIRKLSILLIVMLRIPNKPYVRGHKCARLFYLEALDYIVEEPNDAPDDVAAAPSPTPFDPEMPMISLSAITGIRAQETM